MIRIFVADDHALIREGFKKLIDNEMGMKVIGEAEDGYQVINFIQTNDCDVLVLDISMPGKNGLELLKELKILNPKLKVLILTIHPEERFAIRALKAGASGYLTKVSAPKELVKAIQKVYNGGKYVSPSLAEKLASNLDMDRERIGHEALSDREFEVLRLIASGKPLADIADELSLSQSTVNTYRSRILQKMNLRSNADIIHYAIRHNLLD
ncbi:MAG: response regulator [Calditrichae bacterium]|nr:response regulator [Calditrichia bacterium]